MFRNSIFDGSNADYDITFILMLPHRLLSRHLTDATLVLKLLISTRLDNALKHVRKRYASGGQFDKSGGMYRNELILRIFVGAPGEILDRSSGESTASEAIYRRTLWDSPP